MHTKEAPDQDIQMHSLPHSLFLAQDIYRCENTKSMQDFVCASSRLRWLIGAEKITRTELRHLQTWTADRVGNHTLCPWMSSNISHLSSYPLRVFRHLDSVFDHPLCLFSSMQSSGILFLKAHTKACERLRSMRADGAWRPPRQQD